MALAEAHLRQRFGPEVSDHHVFAICSDGDLEEGISHEAASLAGHLGLGRLVYVYDDNHISIDGPTELAYSDDVPKRFEAYGWHVVQLGEVGQRPRRAGSRAARRHRRAATGRRSSCCAATSAGRRRSTPTPRTPTATRSAPTRSRS